MRTRPSWCLPIRVRLRALTICAWQAQDIPRWFRLRSGSGITLDFPQRNFTDREYLFSGLSMFPPLLAALAMAKEGEQKTILQVYVSSISAHEFLLGKIFAFMAVALAECAVMLILLFTYFGLTLAGDPTPFFIATILYAFCVACIWNNGRCDGSEPGCGVASGFSRWILAGVSCCLGCCFQSKTYRREYGGFPTSSGAGITSRSYVMRSCRAAGGRLFGSKC